MQGRKFPSFLSQKREVDVYHFFHGVTEEKINLPSLNIMEIKYISKYRILNALNRTHTIFPLVKLHPQNSYNSLYYSSEIPNYFEVPLLRSELVRERLFNNDNDPNLTVLILHAFTIEVFDFKSHRIDVFYPKVMQQNLQLEQMDNSILRMFRTFNSHFNAFIVHSSAVVRNGKAALFLAHDGGGKTTVARQVPFNDILGDDQVLLRKQNGGIFAHSTPWNKITSGPVSAPLGAIFLIEKSNRFKLIPLGPKEVIEYLWNEHYYFTDKLPKQSRVDSFILLCEMVNQVPLYLMRTPLNGVNWAAIDACI
jgi:hypothetical protein